MYCLAPQSLRTKYSGFSVDGEHFHPRVAPRGRGPGVSLLGPLLVSLPLSLNRNGNGNVCGNVSRRFPITLPDAKGDAVDFGTAPHDCLIVLDGERERQRQRLRHAAQR